MMHGEEGGSSNGFPPFASPVHSPHLRHGAPFATNGLPDKLAHVDFWPECLQTQDGFHNVLFERSDALLPRVNVWLRDRPRCTVIKCETIEKRISSLDRLLSNDPKFDVASADTVVYIILGLRLWYTSEIPLDARLPSHPSQIGYRNFLPRCTDTNSKTLAFDQLTDTYEDLNETIIERPLEGRIITVESVSLRLARPNWEGPDLIPDQSFWLDGPKYHILCMTRVFFLFECPAYEQIGAADFLPDYLPNEMHGRSPSSPKYSDFYSILVKVNQWLEKVREVRIVNIQTMEALFPGPAQAENINTGANFTAKADTGPLIRFVRITYVRPKFGLPPGGLNVPRIITYKTFVPSVISATPDGSPEFESVNVLWNRVRNWLQQSERKIVGVEVVHHPLPLLLKRKDEGESTVIKGLWVFSSHGSHSSDCMERVPMVELIRVYFDGKMFNPALSPPLGGATSHSFLTSSPSPPPAYRTTQGSRSSSDSPILKHHQSQKHSKASKSNCHLL